MNFRLFSTEFEEATIGEESTKAILSCILTIAETLPLALVASLEKLKDSSPRKVNVLFGSLTSQVRSQRCS